MLLHTLEFAKGLATKALHFIALIIALTKIATASNTGFASAGFAATNLGDAAGSRR
ncbi:hypothetical protein P7L53_18130 [Thermoleptolyngbya sichuanensis XZ-Cy5]|uniref:hypothetical protein n=1 Tax=Thermoleptolyngbya sichuanensis TaxID=2885951 RepID=UPI00240E7B2A|nr:hypothetical protein [Thermoleptolyngbya sichuanensis]MDG2618163.1 hypothetical protein [Thermoleptolyngbya sichuanensis XZ-Cy5]